MIVEEIGIFAQPYLTTKVGEMLNDGNVGVVALLVIVIVIVIFKVVVAVVMVAVAVVAVVAVVVGLHVPENAEDVFIRNVGEKIFERS
jgi:ammonia channel protein AmtB